MMKRSIAAAAAALLCLAAVPAAAQDTFTVPFKFEAAGRSFPAGEYAIVPAEDGRIALRRLPDGQPVQIPVQKRLALPEPPLEVPRLVFDKVGNFEPSYTAYVTDYLLAEVWLSAGEGWQIQLMKGAHEHETVKGVKK